MRIEEIKQLVWSRYGKFAETGLDNRNIEFHVADIAKTLIPDGFVDVVISNSVINLCSDRDAVYEEAFRILRPGGRIAVSDIVFTENIARELQDRFQSTWAGCLGGAIAQKEYLQTVRQAGFAEIQVVARHLLSTEELEAMACCPGEEFTMPPGTEDRVLVEGKVASVKFTAIKPSLEQEN